MARTTYEEIMDALDTYSDFEEVGSVARAKLYITACKRWLVSVAGSASNQSSSLTHNVAQIEAMKDKAVSWVAANDTAINGPGSVRFISVNSGGFR